MCNFKDKIDLKWPSMTLEVLNHFIKNVRIYNVSIHIKFWYNQILKNILKKGNFNYKKDLMLPSMTSEDKINVIRICFL